MSEISCPVCKNRIPEKRWSDDIWGASYLVEYHAKCPTGHWSHGMAYGSFNESVNDREWNWGYDENEADQTIRELEIDRAIIEAKAALMTETTGAIS